MTTRIQRNYKNGLFLMIFGNKQALLSLYNNASTELIRSIVGAIAYAQ